MKKFTKLFLSCAAMAAVTAAVATTAMAAPSLTATYDETNDGTLALKYNDVTLTGETTVLVSTEALTANITDDKILYIDQAAAGEFGTAADGARVVGLLDPDTTDEAYLADGTYFVYVGYTKADGDFAILPATFPVGDVGEDLLIGDVDNSTKIDNKDATAILRKLAKKTTLVGNVGDEYVNTSTNEKVIIGDVDNSAKVDNKDATAILRQLAKKTTLIGNVGETIQVTPAN